MNSTAVIADADHQADSLVVVAEDAVFFGFAMPCRRRLHGHLNARSGVLLDRACVLADFIKKVRFGVRAMTVRRTSSFRADHHGPFSLPVWHLTSPER